MSGDVSAPSVCVALVTFNRKRLLSECLDALLRQTRPVQAIFIVDNGSTDGTGDLLRERGYLDHPHVTLFREETNSGGAGGFHRGIQLGRDAGFDWIWLMDDDAEPASDALAEALTGAGDPTVVAIANYKVSAEGVPQNSHMLLLDGTTADHLANAVTPLPLRFSSFVGLLVRGSVVPQIGLPRSEFFLNQDDTDYCMRLRKAGTILLAPSSVIRHKEAARSGYVERSFLGVRHARAPFRAFVFRYFELRNTAIVYGMQHGLLPLSSLILARTLQLSAAILSFRDDHPMQRIQLVIKAHADALTKTFDNNYPFQLLERSR